MCPAEMCLVSPKEVTFSPGFTDGEVEPRGTWNVLLPKAAQARAQQEF